MDLDANFWYRLTTAAAKVHQQSLAGSYPYINGKEGLVTFGSSDDSVPSQQWQLFPVGDSRFMLRTKASGPYGYLATNGSPSNPRPLIYNHSITDESMVWTVQQSANDTFRLSNDADGQKSHLDFQGVGGIGMSTNTTSPQLGQSFSLIQLERIDDSAFSTAETPLPSPKTTTLTSHTFSSRLETSTSSVTEVVASTTASLQTGPPVASTSPATPAPSTQKVRHGLSFSAILGIGITIGVFSAIVIVAIGLLSYQRWKRNRSLQSQHYRQAKLWKGFSPVHTPSMEDMTVATKRMGRVFVAELPVPVSPPSILSPPLSGGGHLSWGSTRFSWQSFPGSPFGNNVSPSTPSTPPAELPV